MGRTCWTYDCRIQYNCRWSFSFRSPGCFSKMLDLITCLYITIALNESESIELNSAICEHIDSITSIVYWTVPEPQTGSHASADYQSEIVHSLLSNGKNAQFAAINQRRNVQNVKNMRAPTCSQRSAAITSYFLSLRSITSNIPTAAAACALPLPTSSI